MRIVKVDRGQAKAPAHPEWFPGTVWQQMLNDLKTGDKVVTSGGLRGTIIALRDDYIQLRVPPDNLRLEVTRASVASVTAPDDKNNKAA